MTQCKLKRRDPRNGEALYYFKNTIDGAEFSFYVTFIRENGAWKVKSF